MKQRFKIVEAGSSDFAVESDDAIVQCWHSTQSFVVAAACSVLLTHPSSTMPDKQSVLESVPTDGYIEQLIGPFADSKQQVKRKYAEYLGGLPPLVCVTDRSYGCEVRQTPTGMTIAASTWPEDHGIALTPSEVPALVTAFVDYEKQAMQCLGAVKLGLAIAEHQQANPGMSLRQSAMSV